MSTKLLKAGVALIHDDNDNVHPTKTDILIEGKVISKIEPDISPPAGAEVIDCTDKIISPGFISTHHHAWQTQLKGRHADQTLIEYMPSGGVQYSNYETNDFFWGQLGGCMEALDSGTTMIVDHAHMNRSPEASPLAISATVTSGIRSTFGYTFGTVVSQWFPLTFDQNILDPWKMDTFRSLASKAPFGNGRVQLGFAFDLWFLPKEVIAPIFSEVKNLGVKTITTHYMRNPQFGSRGGGDGQAQLMDSYGLLDSTVLLSHASGSLPKDAELIAKRGARVSSTPSTEMQMAMGLPLCFDENFKEIHRLCGLGIDCHSNQAASIPGELRIGLQAARYARNQKFLDKGVAPRKIEPKVLEAFNLGTIGGARAAAMEESIGSIKVGKLADLCVFDGMTPGMCCASEQDPVAAVVLHSTPADVDMVIVDGIVRKRSGNLLPVEVGSHARSVAGKDVLEWKDVARELVRGRTEVQSKIEKLDMVKEEKRILELFGADPSFIVDSV